MALNNTSIGEVRSDGNDSNAGFYDGALGTAGGANDRAFNNNPIIVDGATITATVHTTTTQVNVTGYTVSSADVGNVFRVTGGTGTAGLYRITAVDVPNNRWTVDVSAGSSTQTLTGRVGGALLSIGQASGLAVTGVMIWVKGPFNGTMSSTANVAGGRYAPSVRVFLRGYTTTRGDGGVAVVSPTANSMTCITIPNTGWDYVENIHVDATGRTGVTGFSGGNNATMHNCTATSCATGFTGSGFTSANLCRAVSTLASGTSFNAVTAKYCTSDSANAVSNHFNVCSSVFCLARTSSVSAAGTGFVFGDNQSHHATNCTAINCTTGFSAPNSGGGPAMLFNCLTYNCTTAFAGRGTVSVNAIYPSVYSSASFGHTTLTSNNWLVSQVTGLTSDPFVDAANGNYALNNVPGGGAACRNAGSGAFPQLPNTVGYPDIGAVQALVQGGLRLPRAMNGGYSG